MRTQIISFVGRETIVLSRKCQGSRQGNPAVKLINILWCCVRVVDRNIYIALPLSLFTFTRRLRPVPWGPVLQSITKPFTPLHSIVVYMVFDATPDTQETSRMVSANFSTQTRTPNSVKQNFEVSGVMFWELTDPRWRTVRLALRHSPPTSTIPQRSRGGPWSSYESLCQICALGLFTGIQT